MTTLSDLLSEFLQGLLGTDQINAVHELGVFSSRAIVALLIAAVALIVAGKVRDAIRRFFKRANGDFSISLLLGRVGYFLVVIVGVILILQDFGVNPAALVATLGVVGLAAGLAMQDVLKNVFAGIYLLIERPIRPGERIQVRTFEGVVVTIDLRTTTLRADGELIYVPNAILFAEVLVNRGYQKAAPEETPE